MTGLAGDQEAAPVLRLVVDAANVVGSRPDGWWHDRVGAAARLRDRLAALAGAGLDVADLPEDVPTEDVLPGDVPVTTLERVDCEIVMVVEGKARRITDDEPLEPRLRVVAAAGDGDDQIVAQAATLAPPVVVVTADRALKARVQEAGSSVAGPRWLLGVLDAVVTIQPLE